MTFLEILVWVWLVWIALFVLAGSILFGLGVAVGAHNRRKEKRKAQADSEYEIVGDGAWHQARYPHSRSNWTVPR